MERWGSRILGGQGVLLLVLAVAVGIVGGYGAILFREMILLVNRLAFPGGILLHHLTTAPWYEIVLPPAAGGLIVAPLVYFLAREAKGHGVPEVMEACASRGGRIRPRVAAVKILASALSIGSGGSVGREGPIVQIGSSFGSSVGQFFGLQGERLMVLVAAGAAAGIAATFNAPIAGALFALEIILGRGSARIFSPLVVAAVIATVITRHHLGNTPAFLVPPYRLVSPWELPLYVLLGAVAALAGVGFIRGLYLLEDLWALIPVPEPARGVLGGAVVGGVALWLPQVMGVGYEHIEQVLHFSSPHLPLGTLAGAGMLLVLLLAKIFATGTTIGSGGSGGIFAPSLFMGACLGGAFGTAASWLMPPGTMADPPAYALVSMGALVAATTQAPLTAIIIVFELTDRHTIILPLMLSCILSTVIAMRLSPESIYTLKLVRRGGRIRRGREAEIMTGTRVEELMHPVEQTLRPDTPLHEVVERVVEGAHPEQEVTDGEGHLLGLVHLDDVAALIRDEDTLEHLLVAADVMRVPPGTVGPGDTLDRCMALFGQRGVEEMPVVDGTGRVVGRISRADAIALYNREILRLEAVVRFEESAAAGPMQTERLQLSAGEVKEEIPVDGELLGRTLRDLNLRARFGVSVFALKDIDGTRRFPDPAQPLTKGEMLEVVGPEEQVARVRALSVHRPMSLPLGLGSEPGPKNG